MKTSKFAIRFNPEISQEEIDKIIYNATRYGYPRALYWELEFIKSTGEYNENERCVYGSLQQEDYFRVKDRFQLSSYELINYIIEHRSLPTANSKLCKNRDLYADLAEEFGITVYYITNFIRGHRCTIGQMRLYYQQRIPFGKSYYDPNNNAQKYKKKIKESKK